MMNLEQALEKELNIAIQAAMEAGSLLREEFHRPGGPRGAGGHAAVDVEAEQVIRDALLQAFPSTAFLGEETGLSGARNSRLQWLVDPNDGTDAFLAGWRGSTVSIALVREGRPVLGVVYAPLAPDDGGDLISWAEGMPLSRNGEAIRRAPLPTALTGTTVVAVSHLADDNPVANADCVAPGRFRAIPGIAYRLALVAAGDADAAVSLNRPAEWDLAAGHALLRACGGELVDGRGTPVTYGRAPEGRFFFGGALPVATTLARRPWHTVLSPADPDPFTARYPLARPTRGAAVREAGVLSRAQGCLLGQLAGDALGSLVEFRAAAAIAARHPKGLRDLEDGGTWNTVAGQPTDDSELALMLARTLAGKGRFDAAAVAAAYRDWRWSHPFDIGLTTLAGLDGRPDRGSEANGALMRIGPLGLFGHRLPPERIAVAAREDAAITHPNPVCGDASAAFCVAVAHAVRTGAAPEQVHQAALDWARGARADEGVVYCLEQARTSAPSSFAHQQGWVLTALQNAFHRLLHAPSLEEGVVATVMAGGDTDTNAAIAGALLGAVHGRRAVPPRWERVLLSCRPLPGTPQSRPACFWPVDALELAELLLVRGQAFAGR